ncbi:CDP-alcohol phosphatidyltransferase family protein [Clostridium folliculivorans]|uniref:CDP-diacylglycerol--glycerol-3-phosphate 3-phosphatidyltransferase n=1 Tax=Clostridium folliculivorans TaxID=2886038 RepID=A0A9W5Y183_9CLOT|nr:CDP-alcohol phosphatidyltransferase family protein [Clostridium folliculivorans]GKU24680.1 CDP-diacylglycerol--glycerol-3-phosphate 3-phosphatidyltransferase [Clostridium folliculivorans]GKU30778.1 CDP-diacylglycerol--glycerol-3-phosphate 3-phosphatidyltransferase [Clostridium folliculivorans]
MKFVNKLTMTRLILATIFLVFMSIKGIPHRRSIATAVFIAATMIDVFYENFIRKENKSDKLVVLINSLIDKILVTTALIYLVETNIIPSFVAVTIISVEFAIGGLVSIGNSDGLLLAKSTLEKVKTVFQMSSIIILLSKMSIDYNFHKVKEYVANSFIGVIPYMVLYIALLVTVIYAVDYFFKNRQFINIDR